MSSCARCDVPVTRPPDVGPEDPVWCGDCYKRLQLEHVGHAAGGQIGESIAAVFSDSAASTGLGRALGKRIGRQLVSDPAAIGRGFKKLFGGND